MKWMMYILVASNLVMFDWFNQSRNPGPVTHSLAHHVATTTDVDPVRLLSEPDAGLRVAAHTQHTSHTAGRCHTFGPFRDQQTADDALAEVKSLGREGTLRTDRENARTGYWVYFSSMPETEIETIIQALKDNGISDYHRNGQNELSLGIYNRLEAATRRQASITELGYSPSVGPHYRKHTRYWVDVAEMEYNPHADDAWTSYLSRYADSQHSSMGCELINA